MASMARRLCADPGAGIGGIGGNLGIDLPSLDHAAVRGVSRANRPREMVDILMIASGHGRWLCKEPDESYLSQRPRGRQVSRATELFSGATRPARYATLARQAVSDALVTLLD